MCMPFAHQFNLWPCSAFISCGTVSLKIVSVITVSKQTLFVSSFHLHVKWFYSNLLNDIKAILHTFIAGRLLSSCLNATFIISKYKCCFFITFLYIFTVLYFKVNFTIFKMPKRFASSWTLKSVKLNTHTEPELVKRSRKTVQSYSISKHHINSCGKYYKFYPK